MKIIDLETWDRKDYFDFFSGFQDPNYSVTANVNLEGFYNYVKLNGLPFFASLIFITVNTINRLDNFKLRIRDDKLVKHDVINPIFTVMTPKKLFNFCKSKYMDNYDDFIECVLLESERSKNGSLSIENNADEDDCIYITSLPRISFTQITHPIFGKATSSVPVITFGKYFDENGRKKLPLSIQANHCLVDGIHMAEFFEVFQQLLNEFESVHSICKERREAS